MSRGTQLRGAANAIPFLAAALLVVAVALVPILITGPVFNTPDETSNHYAAREFGKNGTLYFENELTRVDEENLLHIRGFITHQGRAVPMQFLGHPFFWGCAFKLLGEKAWLLVSPALGLFFTIYLYRLFRLVAPKASPLLFLFAFAASPVIYLLGRPFLSASLATVFTVPVFYHAIRYGQTRERTQFLLFSAFLSLALFARPDNIPLALPALYLVISHAAGAALNRRVFRDLLLFLLVFAVLFAAPVLVLNQLTYGSPLTYGYQLVDQTIGLRDMPAPELSGAARLLRTARNIFFPFDFSIKTALIGLFRYFLILTPLLLLTALAGSGGLLRLLRCPNRRWRTVMALLLAAYLVISRAAGNLHGMHRLAPDILDSLARYWMPLYLILLVAGWRALARLNRPLVQAAAGLLAIVLGSYGLLQQYDQSYLKMIRLVQLHGRAWGRMARDTREDTVIYSGRIDKFVIPHRYVATWWETSSGSTYDPQLLARSAARVLRMGRPVALADRTINLRKLRRALNAEGLDLTISRFQRKMINIVEQTPPEEQTDP